MLWEKLNPIADVHTDVKHCDQCDRNVYLVQNEEELRTAISMGRCGAVISKEFKAGREQHERMRYAAGMFRRPLAERSSILRRLAINERSSTL